MDKRSIGKRKETAEYIEKKRNGVELFPIQNEYGRLSPQHATGHHVE